LLNRSRLSGALWSLVAVYTAARVLQLFPSRVPMTALVALNVLPPLVFALLHGAAAYGLRGSLIFAGLSFVVGNAFENLSILTGFPFGHYYFTGVMGPKLFLVPVFLGLAYLGMGYVSWTVGRLLVCGPEGRLSGWRVLATPLVAACAMVAWDLSMEPVWSTLLRCWIWVGGGPYFGVPVTNFLGWYLTVYVFYQLFAVYLDRRPAAVPSAPRAWWRLAVVHYSLCAAGNLLMVLAAPATALATDPAGVPWRTASITAASAWAAVWAMGPFAVLAWIRLRAVPQPAGDAAAAGAAAG